MSLTHGVAAPARDMSSSGSTYFLSTFPPNVVIQLCLRQSLLNRIPHGLGVVHDELLVQKAILLYILETAQQGLSDLDVCTPRGCKRDSNSTGMHGHAHKISLIHTCQEQHVYLLAHARTHGRTQAD